MQESRPDLNREVEALRARVKELEDAAQRAGRTEDAQRESTEMLQLVMDNIPQFVFWKDRDSVYRGCNRNFLEIAGIGEVADIVGKTDYDMAWKKSEADFFRECDRRVMDSNTPEYHIIEPQMQADGKEAWLDTNKVPLHDSEGNVVGILGTFEDITERKRAENALAESEENLRITLNSIGDAVIATDAHGRITSVNPVAETLTGWSQSDAEQKPLLDVFRIIDAESRSSREDPVTKVLETGTIVGLANHTLLIARDGTERQIADSGAPIRNRQGDVVGVVLVFRDVTDQYETESQLRHSQKMESVGQLAGGVAHDINNTLCAIIGAAELTSLHAPADSDSTEFIEMILAAAAQATDLIDKLLAFSRKGKIGRESVDVHDSITAAVRLLEHTIDKSIKLDSALTASESVLHGDATQLQHAILNLGLNARDALPDGGEISFATTNIDLDGASNCLPEGNAPGAYVEISVQDDGCGIPSRQLQHIFEPFFTTKDVGKGTGLGLSAVYGAIARHGGFINVFSDEGVGTVFKVYLPVEPGSRSAPPPTRVESTTRCSGRVLVVDDEPIVRRVAELHLQHFGCEVIVASRGDEAIELYQKQRTEIDLVLLDMVMPGLSGKETFDRLRALDPDVKVLFISGFSRDERVADALARGGLGFIKKPYTRSQLIDAIVEFLPVRSDS